MTQTSETTVPQTPARRLRVPRIPGDIMIYPMIVGLLLNTFCPQVFEIGGFFTAATRGGSNTIVAAILLFVGAGISFKSTPGAIETAHGGSRPRARACRGAGYLPWPASSTTTSLRALLGLHHQRHHLLQHGALHGHHGRVRRRVRARRRGHPVLHGRPRRHDDHPGRLGLANIPVGTIVGSILPLVIGMVLGNLFPFIKNLLVPGTNPAIAVIGFQLGASMSLSSFITGGISGILLGLITLFVVGPVTFAFERLCGGNGKAAVACSTIAGTAMTTPVALAEVAPRYAELAPTAYAQIATAVIITAVAAPIAHRLG